VRWPYPASSRIGQVWNGVLRSNAPNVVVGNASNNARLVPNQATTFGLNAAGSPGNPTPTCSSP
jgi:hypothetical protein